MNYNYRAGLALLVFLISVLSVAAEEQPGDMYREHLVLSARI